MHWSTFLHRLQRSEVKFLRHFALFIVLINTLWLGLPVQAESVTLNMDLFEPLMLETEEAYVYVTSFGNYSFSKQDGTYAFTYLDGTKLCPSVKFILQHLIGDSWEGLEQKYLSLRGLSNDHFAFSINVLNQTRLMGVLDVDCAFSRASPPKMTVKFRELEECQPFRLVFKVTVPQAWRYFEDGQIIEMTQTEYKLRGKTVRLYNQSDMRTPLRLLIDWSDFGTADCLLKGSTVRVIFPTNQKEVDPSTIAETVVSWTVNTASQRKMFFAQGRWFVAYRDKLDIWGYYVFKTSTDGESWSESNNMGQDADKEFSWCYDSNNNTVHYVSLEEDRADLYYRAGHPQTDGTIDWLDSLQKIVDTTDDLYQIGIATDSNGFPFVIYFLRVSAQNCMINVTKSSWNNGSWSTEFDVKLSQGSIEFEENQIVSMSDAKMYAIFYNETYHCYQGKLWNSTAWEALENCTDYQSGVGLGLSSVAIDDTVHLAFNDDQHGVGYVQRDNVTGWSTETTIFDEGLIYKNYPAMCKLGSDLMVFWIQDKTIYSRKYVSGVWQDIESQVMDAFLIANSANTVYDASNNRLGFMYRETAGSTLLKFWERESIVISLSASPSQLDTGQQATISWTLTYVNGTEVSSYTLNITRDETLILQDSSQSSWTDIFGTAGVHSYTCSGVTDGTFTSFEANSVSVEWTGEETKGTGGREPFEELEDVGRTVGQALAETGLYWLAGFVVLIIIGGVYASTKTQKVSRQARGQRGKRSASPRGHTGGRQAQPRGVSRKRKRDARGRFA